MRTPFDELNDLLGGGFVSNELVELTGPSKSGKTTLALYVILSSLLEDHYTTLRSTPRPPQNPSHPSTAPPPSGSRKNQGEALYIDTLNIFSAETALEIVLFLLQERRMMAEGGGREMGEREGDYEIAVGVLDRLTVATCFDVPATIETIESAIALNPPSLPPPFTLPTTTSPLNTIDEPMIEEVAEERGRLRIVLIDTMETLFPTLEGGVNTGQTGGSAKAQAGLVAFMRKLREFARGENILFFVRPFLPHFL